MDQSEVNAPASPKTQVSAENAFNCKDDEAVPCKLLMGECNSSQYGGQLRRDCPMTCGVCRQGEARNVELIAQNVTKNSAARIGPCEDNMLLPCEKLVDKCFSPLDGERVQVVCPASCGLCNAALTAHLRAHSKTANSEASCSDRQGLNVDEDIIACSELVRQCKASVLSKQIQAACPKTCGVCTMAAATP